MDCIDVEKTIEVLFIQPYCRIKNFVDAGIVHCQTVSKYIDKFIALGILQESNLSKKSVVECEKIIFSCNNCDSHQKCLLHSINTNEVLLQTKT